MDQKEHAQSFGGGSKRMQECKGANGDSRALLREASARTSMISSMAKPFVDENDFKAARKCMFLILASQANVSLSIFGTPIALLFTNNRKNNGNNRFFYIPISITILTSLVWIGMFRS